MVGSPTVDDNNPAVGATFTLSTTVRNDGEGASPATTLRYYRSTDATIRETAHAQASPLAAMAAQARLEAYKGSAVGRSCGSSSSTTD